MINYCKTNSCKAMGQQGRYKLDATEELIVLSYPGPPRGETITGVLPHQLNLPTLLPILTVTNETGTVDVVVEAFPNEHRFDANAPELGSGIIPPDQQPQVSVCQRGSLINAIVFPEEGQPGINRNSPLGTIAKVEARPIYFVQLDSAQSTTVYAAPPGGWIRLRANQKGAKGSYCLSWCCPPAMNITATNGEGKTDDHDPPPYKEQPPRKPYSKQSE